MPERLSDVEGWHRDLLGSKDLNEGGGSAPGFCWAVASPGSGERRKESGSMIEAPFFSVPLGTGFWWCRRFRPKQDRSKGSRKGPIYTAQLQQGSLLRVASSRTQVARMRVDRTELQVHSEDTRIWGMERFGGRLCRWEGEGLTKDPGLDLFL